MDAAQHEATLKEVLDAQERKKQRVPHCKTVPEAEEVQFVGQGQR